MVVHIFFFLEYLSNCCFFGQQLPMEMTTMMRASAKKIKIHLRRNELHQKCCQVEREVLRANVKYKKLICCCIAGICP